MKKIVIFGANSAIAKSLARNYAQRKYEFLLVARNSSQLEILKKDLLVRGAKSVHTFTMDLNEVPRHQENLKSEVTKFNPDILVVAHGYLGNLEKDQHSLEALNLVLHSNLNSPAEILSLLTPILNPGSQIAVITSVAGERGRKSNYYYAAAKAGMIAYLSGLRAAYSTEPIYVLDVRPGFVDTPMTKDFKKGLLWAQPEKVALEIEKAIENKKDVLYTPWFWRWIILIVKLIPEFLFKKLSI